MVYAFSFSLNCISTLEKQKVSQSETELYVISTLACKSFEHLDENWSNYWIQNIIFSKQLYISNNIKIETLCISFMIF